MSDRYNPNRAPFPWDEDDAQQQPPRRPPSSSRGGPRPRPSGRPPSGQPQPPYGWNEEQQPGNGGPARPSRPQTGRPPSGYPQSGYPQSGYPDRSQPQSGYPQSGYPQQPQSPYPAYGQPDGYGDFGAPPPPAQGRGRPTGSGQYRDGAPYASGSGRPRGRTGTGYGQPGAGMQGDGYGSGAPPSNGWDDVWSQPNNSRSAQRPQDPYFPMLPDPQAQAQARYGSPAYPVTVATPPAAARKRRSLKWLWITLAVVVVLVLAGGGAAVWALGQIAAPGVAAGQFCANLGEQKYDTAYGQFSTSMRAGLSQAQFQSDAADLDSAEGKVTSCRASGNVAYSLGSATADIGLVVTRATQGNLTGNVQMKNEGGAWKVDALDTTLLGVNFGTVQAVDAYCAALQGQNYAAAYALLDSTQQSAQTVAAFTSDAKLHDQIDGKVNACALKSIATGNTDTAASVAVTITRAKLGQSSGALALSGSGSGSGSQWKITSVDKAVQGTDLQPLTAGQKFCSLLSQAKYTDAYNSTSSGFKKATASADFMALFNVSGVKWTCGSANLSTYKVAGASASYVVSLTAKDTASGTMLLSETRGLLFVLEGSTWKLQYFGDPAQLGD